LAYGAAYHPAHSFAYLHLLLRKNLGQTIFGSVSRSPRILVLGSGLAAETLAITIWLQLHAPDVLSASHFTLVDRANWIHLRQQISFPILTTKELGQQQIEVEEVTLDLAEEAGESFLAGQISSYDLIFCPSLLSEMYTEKSSKRLIEVVHSLMSPQSVLVVFDHHLGNRWRNIRKVCAENFNFISESEKPAEIIIPAPPQWFREHLLDGSDGLKPLQTLTASWLILGNP
jgi:hypothetical protein